MHLEREESSSSLLPISTSCVLIIVCVLSTFHFPSLITFYSDHLVSVRREKEMTAALRQERHFFETLQSHFWDVVLFNVQIAREDSSEDFEFHTHSRPTNCRTCVSYSLHTSRENEG